MFLTGGPPLPPARVDGNLIIGIIGGLVSLTFLIICVIFWWRRKKGEMNIPVLIRKEELIKEGRSSPDFDEEELNEEESKTKVTVKDEDKQEEESNIPVLLETNINSNNNNISLAGTDGKKPKSSIPSESISTIKPSFVNASRTGSRVATQRRTATSEQNNNSPSAKVVRFSPSVEAKGQNGINIGLEVKPLERLPSSTAGRARNRLSRSPPSQFSLGETEEDGLRSPPPDENYLAGSWAATAAELGAAASTAAWTAGSWTAGMVAAKVKASLGGASDEMDITSASADKPKDTSVKVEAMLTEEETLYRQGRDLQSLRLEKEELEQELGQAQAKYKKEEEEGEHLRAKVRREQRNRDEVADLEERLARLRTKF